MQWICMLEIGYVVFLVIIEQNNYFSCRQHLIIDRHFAAVLQEVTNFYRQRYINHGFFSVLFCLSDV